MLRYWIKKKIDQFL